MSNAIRFPAFATFFAGFLLASAVFPQASFSKSLYLASEHHQSLFDAWSINPDGTVTKQATYNLQYSTDPAGIAIDADSETIFITSEFSAGVEMVDPVSLSYLGVSTGPENLAGIAVDDQHDIVYAVQRQTNHLFIFQWDPVAKTLTQIQTVNLPNCQQAFGIALDETRDILWVADPGAGAPLGDIDIYHVTGLPPGQPVDIEITTGTFDSILALLDSSGNILDTNDDGGQGLLSRLSSVMPESGGVFVAVTAYSDFSLTGAHSQQGTYELSIWPSGTQRPSAPLAAETEPNGNIQSPTTVQTQGQVVIQGALAPPTPGTSGIVRAYDITTWQEDTSKTYAPAHSPVDVAADRRRNLVYTVSIIGGATVPPGTGSTLLSKYDVSSGQETTTDMGVPGVGVAVDETTGYVYVTSGADSGDSLTVWDTSTTPFTLVQDTGPIGNPAGIAIANVSYNPLNLAKDDVIVAQGVHIGDTFSYDITCDNLNNPTLDATNVTILDTLPDEVDFVSTTQGGAYDDQSHTVLWDLGTIAGGGTCPSIDLVVRVNDSAVPGSTINNYATINYTMAGDDNTTTVEDDEGSDDPDDQPGTPVIEICGDLNHDGDVDGVDRAILRSAFRTHAGDPTFISEADYDSDGYISFNDYRIWYGCYKEYVSQLP